VATILPGNLLSAWADAPALPNNPVTLNIIDVAGNLQLTKRSIENYRKANPKLLAKSITTRLRPLSSLVRLRRNRMLGALTLISFSPA
jgi:hypothetical protein